MKVAAVVIRSGDEGAAGFEVRGPTSAPFATNCRLEAALATLAGAAAKEWTVTTSPAGSVVSVGRRKVKLREPMAQAEVAAVIRAAAGARIEDLRPASRRRQDLSGLRCDLSDGYSPTQLKEATEMRAGPSGRLVPRRYKPTGSPA